MEGNILPFPSIQALVRMLQATVIRLCQVGLIIPWAVIGHASLEKKSQHTLKKCLKSRNKQGNHHVVYSGYSS